MAKWRWRSGLYKTATVFTFFVFLVYGLAFSTPSWFGDESNETIQFQGLWLLCFGSDEIDFDNCTRQAFGEDWEWMDGVRGCWVGGMFFFLVGVLFSLVENFCGNERSRDYGLTGTLVLLAGLCGSAGVILTAVKVSDDNGYDEFYWGFMIACIASGLAILLAIALLIARNSGISDDDYYYEEEEEKRRHGSRAIDYVNNYGKQPNPDYGYGGSPYEYHNAGYRGDHYPGGHHDGYNPPLGNGVSYHHQPTPAQHPYTMYQGSSLPRHNGGGYRHSMAESADLSNGFTPTIIHAEQSHVRPPRGDYYLNGSRPY
ncbi:hypothetical protein RRG08_036889 [Elysia crispata]|uniref:Uncharacterized protein n=1 Tax=Elysia crispata TaxID=231223 RepID=A0AAE0ZBB9_9GAST|nr:hypothetical protein RRG08_036889 [Elysia crispata]